MPWTSSGSKPRIFRIAGLRSGFLAFLRLVGQRVERARATQVAVLTNLIPEPFIVPLVLGVESRIGQLIVGRSIGALSFLILVAVGHGALLVEGATQGTHGACLSRRAVP